MYLEPKDAVILFVRRSDTEPARYMASIRKVETEFDLVRNDLKVGAHQRSLSEVGEFLQLSEAIDAASTRLRELVGQQETHANQTL